MSSVERELTMLFTDVEGSTRHAQALGDAWPDVLATHRRLIRDEVEQAGGTVETTEGDSFFATFPAPAEAAQVAGAVQRGLRDHRWPQALGGDLRVRMGIHIGPAQHTDGHWVGVEVHRAARIADAANGGQVIVSEPVQVALGDTCSCEDLGRHRLKSFTGAERLFHLCIDDRRALDFPPPRTLGAVHSILERETELGRISDLVAQVAHGGAGATLVIEGPAGIGKTRLADAVRGVAVEHGMEVSAARGAELERGFPFGLVRQLLDPPLAAAGAAQRSELLDGAAALALGALGEKPSVAVDMGGVMHGLYWLIAALADRGPLLLLVDDAQWGDEASLRFLAYLFRRAESLPVLVAMASRPPSSDETGTLVSELAADPGAELLRLGALGAAGVARLLGEQLGRPADLEFAEACLEATGGNPFLLGELARELQRQEIDPKAREAGRVAGLQPDRVARSLTVRIGRSGDAAGHLAPAIALLGDGAELSLAGELAGLATDTAADALDGLVREGVLVPDLPPRYAHPLLRTAAEGLLAPAERSRLHARAAELLTDRGASVERVASHLLETQPSGEAQTVEVLAKAARQADERGAPDAAARLLRRALEDPPSAAQRPALQFDLGRAERDLGLSSAPESLRAAAEADDPVLAARATRALVWAIGPNPAEHLKVVSLLDRAIDRVTARDRELARELEAVRLGSLWLVPELADRLERELPHYRDLPGESAAESLALTFVARVLMQRGEPAAAVEAVAMRAAANDDAARDDDMAALWLISMTVVMIAVDQFAVAERVVERGLAVAHERGSANRFALASNLRGIIRHCAGDLEGAEADARAALASEGLKGMMGHQSLIPLVGSLADQGRIDEGRRVLADSQLDGAVPEARPLTALLVERGRLLVAAGDANAGLIDLEDANRRLPVQAAGKGAIGLDAWLDRILALHTLGRDEEAHSEAGQALEAARAWGTDRAVGGALRVNGLLADGEEGLDLLREAAETLAASPARLWHARALVDLGAALYRAGQHSQARQPLQEGLDLAERCGAIPLAETARQELAVTGIEVMRHEARRDALTAAERRIAELAAEGASNTQIAQDLFVTVKAVEGHLSQAYEKLCVRSHRELRDALADRDST
ncbi:MAG TPA: AAA family ATPase [Solirubrobacterales bacterium]|nr:AAA family ATPase [Solirubrobacterales bacterium]